MKQITIIITLVGLCYSLFGNNTPSTHTEALNVIAPSGLKLRLAPNIHSDILSIVPFGEEVIIIETPDSSTTSIDYTIGNWIKAEYEGEVGYIFDGFLTSLSIPTQDFEITDEADDLIFCLSSWAQYNLDIVLPIDTMNYDNGTEKTIRLFEDGSKLTTIDHDRKLDIKLDLTDIRIMDAYHLLESMIIDKKELQRFKESSIFIKNKTGDIDRIKIGLDNNITIKTAENGKIRITINYEEYGC